MGRATSPAQLQKQPETEKGIAMYVKQQANDILKQIGEAQHDLEECQAKYDAQVKALQESWAERLAPTRDLIDRLDKNIKVLMKENRDFLFPEGTDQVTLQHGTLLHGHGEHVAIPRNAVKACEDAGYNDAVKIAKSIDRAVVEKWPNEKLFVIGAERKPIEKFEYEIKQ